MPLIDPVTMSSAGGALKSTPKAKDDATVLQPIRVNATPLAQAATHIVPALQLGVLLIRFDALVTDSVSTMWSSLPIVVALQVVYALVCLPVAGSQSPKAAKKPGRADRKKQGAETTGPSVSVAAFLSLLLTAFAAPLLHGIIILFGAPALTQVPQTLLCAATLAALALFPLFYVHGVDGAVWTALASGQAPLDDAYGGLLGAVVGAWLGAVPIPLDWDRDWQQWPITILCGLYGGYVFGKLVGGTLAFGRRFSNS